MTDAQALAILKSRADLGSLDSAKVPVVRAATNLAAAAKQLGLRDAAQLRREAEPRITDNASLAEDLRRTTQQFGGRMVVYPVMPNTQAAQPRP